MNTISTIKKLSASSAMAGVLGLAALGLGSGFASAAPSAHSGPGPIHPSSTSNKFEPEQHPLFPITALNPHIGQGHKGWNEPKAPVGIRDPFTSGGTSK